MIDASSVLVAILVALAGSSIKVFFLSKTTGDDWVSEFFISKKTLKSTVDLEDSVIPLTLHYPPLHYFILSRFRQEQRSAVGLALNMVYDFLSTLIVFFLTYYIVSGYTPFFERARDISIFSSALFAFSPLLTPVHARIMGLKSRSLGSFISLSYFSSMYVFFLSHNFLALVPCIFFGILALMASQMAYQSVFFLSFALAVVMASPWPLVIVSAVVFFTFLVPVIDIYEILKNKVAHFRWYAKTIDSTMIASRGPIRSLKILFSKNPSTTLLDKISWVMSLNPIIIFVVSVPMAVLLLAAFLFDANFSKLDFENDALRLALLFTLAGVLVFLITSIRPFVVAGEAERYIESILPFLNIIGLIYLLNSSFFLEGVISLLMLGVLGVALNYLVLNSRVLASLAKSTSRISPSGLRLIMQLEVNSKRLGRPVKVVTAPTKLSFLFSSNSKKGAIQYLYSAGYSRQMKFDWMLNAFPDYLHLRNDLSFYRINYGVDLAIISRNISNQPRYKEILSRFPVLFKDEEFFVVSTTPIGST